MGRLSPFIDSFWFIASAVVVVVFLGLCVALALLLLVKGEG